MIRFLRPLPDLEFQGEFIFPSPEKATREGIVCAGGNLSRGMVLSAYRQGIFPWYDDSSPILWWSPNPRFVVFPSAFHVPKSARKLAKREGWTFSLDRAFPQVIVGCASVERPRQDGTWIVPEMIEAYMALHEDGYAHSLEVWENGNLIGGLYGLSLGAIFFGESMFSLKSGASRAGFLRLGSFLFGNGFLCIDSQVRTDYIAGMGGREIPRTQYLGILKSALAYPDRIGDWGSLFPTFDASGSVLGVENFHDMA